MFVGKTETILMKAMKILPKNIFPLFEKNSILINKIPF
jgi:hypothetical protein